MTRTACLLSAALLLSTLAACRHEGAIACDEFVDVLATRLVECGEFATYEDAEIAVIMSIAEGSPARVQSCDDIWGLRNRVDFHDECIPGIMMMDCTATELPVTCQRQLLYE